MVPERVGSLAEALPNFTGVHLWYPTVPISLTRSVRALERLWATLLG